MKSKNYVAKDLVEHKKMNGSLSHLFYSARTLKLTLYTEYFFFRWSTELILRFIGWSQWNKIWKDHGIMPLVVRRWRLVLLFFFFFFIFEFCIWRPLEIRNWSTNGLNQYSELRPAQGNNNYIYVCIYYISIIN